jgi:outer membrane protein insertion porin family
MKKVILIFLLVVSIILPVYAEETSISDIKVQGLKRVDPGLVFDNIPFEVNSPINEANFSEAIQLLYKTGQFKNISIDLEGSVVIIIVNEKPLVSTITFHGADAIQPDKIKEGMLQMNFGEGLLFNETTLKRVSNEISKQYLNLGLYSATVKTKATPQERNRVAIDFYINEGSTARSKEVKIIWDEKGIPYIVTPDGIYITQESPYNNDDTYQASGRYKQEMKENSYVMYPKHMRSGHNKNKQETNIA